MALSEENFNHVRKILGVTKTELEYQINFLGATFTAQDQVDVETEITRWETASTSFTSFKATESNKGFEKSSSSEKADIQKNVAILLERPDWTSGAGAGSSVQGMVYRG